MKAVVAPHRRGLLIPAVFVLAALAVLMTLGVWQLERLRWKEDLIATLDRRLSAPPVPLKSLQWSGLDKARDEFRRVSARVQFANDLEARVYTGGGGLRNDVKGPGYFAFAPATVAETGVILINRGFVANPNPDASLRPVAVPDKPIDIVGALRWPERAGIFVTAYSKQQDLWFVRDHLAMWNHYGWGNDARYDVTLTTPFYIEQESPVPPGGVPRPGQLTVKLRNDHLGYALTWFGLAVVLLVTFGFWIVSRAR